jgi:hypothetical protein
MADRASAGATSGLILGGLLCLGLILFGIAATIVLSLIPAFTQNHGQQGYGSAYAFDALMLKFLYDNATYTFANGTVANSTDLSLRCIQQYARLGIKNFAGCILYNGKAFGPNNASTSSRRRRAATQAGMYYISSGYMFTTTSCPSSADKNKTSNSTQLSSCVSQGLAACNLLLNATSSAALSAWTSATSLVLEIYSTTDQLYHAVNVNNIYGAPPALANSLASSLGVDNSTKASLQRGCRYVGSLPLSTIYGLLSSVTSSNITTDATTQPTG